MQRKFNTDHLKAKKPEEKRDDRLLTAVKNCLRADIGNDDLDESGLRVIRRLLSELTREHECSTPPKVTKANLEGGVDVISNTRNRCVATKSGNLEITVLLGRIEEQIVEVYYSPINIFTKVTDSDGNVYETISTTLNSLSFKVVDSKGGKHRFFLKSN